MPEWLRAQDFVVGNGAGTSGRCAGAGLMERKTMAVDVSMPILIVDDYNTMIRIIRNLLKQLGFENVDDANDGTSALAKMRARRRTASSSPTGTWRR